MLTGTLGISAGEVTLLKRPPNTSDLAQALVSDRYTYIPRTEPPIRQQVADMFSLQSPAVISSVTWWGYYYPVGTLTTVQQPQFQIRMFAGRGGIPPLSLNPVYDVTVLASLSPFKTVQDHPTYAFSALLPVPFETQMGAGYWLQVLESDTLTDNAFAWFNSGLVCDSIGVATRAGDGDSWAVGMNCDQMSFSLFGTVVPEPSGRALLLLGAVISLALRWLINQHELCAGRGRACIEQVARTAQRFHAIFCP